MSTIVKALPFVVLCALIIAVPSVWANWVQDGVALCTAGGPQYSPFIASDGSGGGIIAWIDQRSGTRADIYAQRIDADGAILWAANGVPVCTASGYTYRDLFRIVSDGSGGAIIAWRDDRNGPAYDYRIYAQRINAAGSAVWTTDGIPICTGNGTQDELSLIPDGSGGAIAAWEDYRSGITPDIYAQRISPTGSRMWTAYGAAVCTESKAQYSPWLASDGSGGAIVAWRDIRSDSSFDIYAQRIAANGTAMWTVDGVAVCAAIGDQQSPQIAPDGSGGAVFAWKTVKYVPSESWDISAQRVDANGSVLWAKDGVAIRTGGVDLPLVASDGSGGAIVVWPDGWGGLGYDVYAQRVSADGSVLWTADGVPISTAAGDQYPASVLGDGSGGAIISLRDKRSGELDLYAQKIDADGQVRWMANGVPVCTLEGNQCCGMSTSDGSGGAIVTWYDLRSGNADIYAQRVDAAGHTVVATLLQDYAADFSGDQIAITWTLSEIDEGIEFFLERTTASDRPFIEVPSSAMKRDKLSFTFTDSNWQPNTSYWYRVEYQIGNERKVLFETGPIATPALPLTLYQNSPNPFNPSTTIGYYLPEKCRVRLELYDISGRRIASLANGEQEKGRYAAEWNGKDDRGGSVVSGVYFYKLAAGRETISRKMVLIR